MRDTKELFLDVIHDRIKGSMLSRQTEDTYMLRYVDPQKNKKVDTLVSNADLYSIDTRLPEVMAEMADNNYGKILSIRRLQTTMLVHWARQNHVLEVVPRDDLYNHHVAPTKQLIWYLSSVKDISALESNPLEVHARMLCYSVARTKSGVEYVLKKTEARLYRNLDWLDMTFRNGRAVLDIIETLNLMHPELADYLYTQYVAVPAPDELGCELPDGLNLS